MTKGEKEILKLIENEENYYNQTRLKTNPSFAQTQADVLELCQLYYLSKRRDSNTDSQGRPKVFYNISALPVEVASKMMDIDTRNIQLKGTSTNSYWASWIKSKELWLWMKMKYFAKQLNLYPYYLAKYGHLFLKKVDGDVFVINPESLIVRPDADNLKETPIIEVHEKPIDTFMAMAKERGWENADKVAKEFEKDKLVKFYEAYFPPNFLEMNDNYFIFEPSSGAVLVHSYRDKPHYKDLAWEKIDGRLLGRGQIEKLFKDQIYLNRIANYKAEGLHWSSLNIFQTKDNNVTGNVLNNLENGDMIFANSPIDKLPVEERNLQMYSYDEQRWENNALRKSFSREPVTGERSPSGVPLGSTILNVKMTAGYYDQKKENLSSLLKEVINDWVLPDFEKEHAKEHKVLIENLVKGGDNYSDKFMKMLVSKEMGKKVREQYSKGRIMREDQYKVIEGIVSEKIKNQEMDIPKNFYNNLKHETDITIVGESIDVSAKLGTLQTVLQMLGSNPSIVQDPRTLKILKKTLDLAGFNPHDLDLEETPDLGQSVSQAKAVRGGSIAASRTAQTAQQPTSFNQKVAT